jgi:hypothetical protein
MMAIVLAGLAIGVADIVIGARYLHSTCHIDDLAVYLIVAGVLGLVCFLLRCCRKKKAGKDGENPDDSEPSCIEWLFIITYVSILIWGMTLVWDTERGDCPVTLYEYGYYRTVIGIFIGTAIMAIAMLYCICSVGIVACCDSDANTSCVVECGTCMTGKKPKTNAKLQENINQINEMMNMLNTVNETIQIGQLTSHHAITDTITSAIHSKLPAQSHITVDIPSSGKDHLSSTC